MLQLSSHGMNGETLEPARINDMLASASCAYKCMLAVITTHVFVARMGYLKRTPLRLLRISPILCPYHVNGRPEVFQAAIVITRWNVML